MNKKILIGLGVVVLLSISVGQMCFITTLLAAMIILGVVLGLFDGPAVLVFGAIIGILLAVSLMGVFR